jgi:hypothetical protein
MPFGINRHSNRSKQALNETTGQGTATPSSGGSELSASPIFADEARTTQPQAFSPQARADVQPYNSSPSPAPDSDKQQKSGELPTRSQSTRYVSAYQPQGVPYQPGGSADDLTLDSRKNQQQGGPQVLQPPAAEPKKSKNIFDRMRSGSSRSSEQKPPLPVPSYNNTAGLARRLSKRQENPPVIRTVQQRNSAEQQRLDWTAGQDSRSHLPSPQEGNEDDSGLDPYLIREAGQGTPHIALNEEGFQQSIRPVQGETESLLYAADEDHRLQFETQQQHLRDQVQHYHSESGSQPYHQLPGQPQVNIAPGSLIISDPYRQNPETVSQISYESATDLQELRPVSVQSNGQSPTSYTPQRQEYPGRTTSIQNPRPLSQYGVMAPPPVGAQQGRRAGDSKQTLPGNSGQGQGQPESRDGPPPNYTRGQFPNTQPPTPGLTTLPSVVGAQGPNYRGGPPQRDQYGPTGGGDQGRNTPPPAPGDRDVNDAYKELRKLECHYMSHRMLIISK